MITVTLVNKRHIAAANAAYTATIPADPEQTPPYASVDEYVQAAIERVAESWRNTTQSDRISTAEFLMRFTPTEFADLKQAAVTDPIAGGLMTSLSNRPDVWLGSDEAQQGVGYLVTVNLLTAARAEAVLAYGVPE